MAFLSSYYPQPVVAGTTAGTYAAGNDARLSDARTPTIHGATHGSGVKASFSGQVAGMTENILIRADNAGVAGNGITLSFNGSDDIDTVLAEWNSENASNQATIISGSGGDVPENGEQITLAGGLDASDPITDAVFETLRVNDGEVEFGSPLNPNLIPFKVESQDASNTQIAQVLGFNKKGTAFYGTGALGTDGPVVQATHYLVTNSVNFYVNPFGGNVIVGGTTDSGSKLQVSADIEVTNATKGLILRSANGTRYRLTIDNGGIPTTTAL